MNLLKANQANHREVLVMIRYFFIIRQKYLLNSRLNSSLETANSAATEQLNQYIEGLQNTSPGKKADKVHSSG